MAYSVKMHYQWYRHPLNSFQSFNLIKTMTNLIRWWLCYTCFLCLIINNKCDQNMVHASYSEADLTNELDRPSK